MPDSGGFDADCIVIGSGPAGVSAAFPLVQAGMRVLMIDGVSRAAAGSDSCEPRWRRMIGENLEGLVPDEEASPKLRTPKARRITSKFRESSKIRAEGFTAVGALARGGLSQIWGGFACEFDGSDLESWPISIDELAPSYRTITSRIGVSGSSSDDMSSFYGQSSVVLPPLPVGPVAGVLLGRYRKSPMGSNFGLGLARHAILTVDKEDRQACDLRNQCLWGCERGAIYDARFDVAQLEKHEKFRLLDDAVAVRLIRTATCWSVGLQNGLSLSATRVILAAGVLGTLPLVIPLLPESLSELRLLSNPVFAMAMLLPSQLGKPVPERGYSLAQLGYRYQYGKAPEEYVTGVGFEVVGLPPSSFAARLPFSRCTGMNTFRALSTAMVVCTGFFPGACSDNRIRWQRDGGRISIVVSGGGAPHLDAKFREVRSALRKIWWRLGAWVLPGTTLAPPGADAHYAGPLAMDRQLAHGTTPFGELLCAPGVFVVDAAIFPTLPSKFLTLTVMANADRIGRYLARSHVDRV